MGNDEALERVRVLCRALPETTERLSHGTPTFFVRDKRAFVTYVDNHHNDGRQAVWCNAPPGLQQSLIERDPSQFFTPPYVGVRGWVGVRLERDPDWEQVAELIELAYRTAAPKKLVAMLG